MADLTPEEIALGVRAVKAGWAWEVGDIVREVKDGGDATDAMVVTRTAGAFCIRTLEPGNQFTLAIHGAHRFFPDPTARGFVSAALAQVRERSDALAYTQPTTIFAEGSPWGWVCWSGDAGFKGSTEAEAVVGALEATKP